MATVNNGYSLEHLRHDLLVMFMLELRERSDLTGKQRMDLYHDLLAIMEEERRLQSWIDQLHQEAQ